MLSCEIIESFFSMMTKNKQNKNHRYHSAAQMVFSNYLKYVQNVGENRETGAHNILIGQMSLFKDEPNFPTEYLIEIIDDINTGGKQHRTLLEEDDDLMDRLISITRTDFLKRAPMVPSSMNVGRDFTESRLMSSDKLESNSTVFQKAIMASQWVEAIRSLGVPGEDKERQENVSGVLIFAVNASRWDVAKLILGLTGENKANQDSVSQALVAALTASQWDVVKLILELTEENRLKQEDVSMVLPLAQQAGQLDIIMMILEFTGENKANQKDVENVLGWAGMFGHVDLVKRIFELTGENKVNQENVNRTLLFGVFYNHSDITKLILKLTGDNKATQETVSKALTFAIKVGRWDLAILILELTEEEQTNAEAIADALSESFKTFQPDVVKHPLIVPMVLHQKTAMKIILEKYKTENKYILCKYIVDIFRYMDIYQAISGAPLEKAQSMLLNYTEVNPTSSGFFSVDIDRECIVAVKQVVQSIGKDIKDLATLLEKLKEITPQDPIGSLVKCIQYIETQNQETANIVEGQIPSIAVAKEDEHFTAPEMTSHYFNAIQ